MGTSFTILSFFFSEWALLPSLPLSWPLNHLLSSQSLIWILLFLMLQGQTWEERPKRGKREDLLLFLSFSPTLESPSPPSPPSFRPHFAGKETRNFSPKSSRFFREGPSPSLAVCLCVGFLLLLLTPQPNRGSGERGVGGA